MLTRYRYSDDIVVEEKIEGGVRERRLSVKGAYSEWKRGLVALGDWELSARGGAPRRAAKLMEVRQAG